MVKKPVHADIFLGHECELVSQCVVMILSMSQCGYGTECEPVWLQY